jgi:hypothetical protein
MRHHWASLLECAILGPSRGASSFDEPWVSFAACCSSYHRRMYLRARQRGLTPVACSGGCCPTIRCDCEEQGCFATTEGSWGSPKGLSATVTAGQVLSASARRGLFRAESLSQQSRIQRASSGRDNFPHAMRDRANEAQAPRLSSLTGRLHNRLRLRSHQSVPPSCASAVACIRLGPSAQLSPPSAASASLPLWRARTVPCFGRRSVATAREGFSFCGALLNPSRLAIDGYTKSAPAPLSPLPPLLMLPSSPWPHLRAD